MTATRARARQPAPRSAHRLEERLSSDARREGARTRARRTRRRAYRNFRKPISSAKSEKQLRRGRGGRGRRWEMRRGRARALAAAHAPHRRARRVPPRPPAASARATRAHSPAAQHHLVLADEAVSVAAAPAARGRGAGEAVAAWRPRDRAARGALAAARSRTHQVREPGPYVCGCVPWMPGPGILYALRTQGGAGGQASGARSVGRCGTEPADNRGGSARTK